MTLRILTDTASDIPDSMADELGIGLIPLNIHFGDEQLKDRRDITGGEFFGRLASSSVHPTTSQPSPGEFAEAYQALIDDGADEILFVSIHGNLSGTLDSAKQAIELVSGARIDTVDTRRTSFAQGIPAVRAAEIAKNGGGLDEAKAVAEDIAERSQSLVIADTLEYLKKGGRLSQSQYVLGSMLRVKPILGIGDEPPYVTIATRVRTLKKALETMVNMASEQKLEWAAIVHGEGLESAQAVQSLLQPHIADVPIYEVTPVLGVQLGPGTVGLHWVPAKE